MTDTAADPTHLRVDRRADGVAVLTLDDPDRRNAMSDAMTDAWVQAVDALADDRDRRAVVVTGAGTAFCSGGNTGWIASEPDASVDRLRTRMIAFYRAWLSIRRLEVPTIAAVNGAAVGAGLCFALSCDLVYAADEAFRMGLVSAVLPAEGFLDAVLETAAGIAATAPVASRLTTLALRAGGHPDLESAVQWEALAQPVTLATADLQEGVAAAREKRAPRFTGR